MAMAELRAHQVWYFNINPNSINWTYTLNTNTIETYGGRVVQILSINWDDLSIDFDSGSGGDNFEFGREYLRSFANFFRDAILWQRDTGTPCNFILPSRGYSVSCYLSSLSVKDQLENVAFPYSIKAKIQKDINGLVTANMYTKEITRLTKGVGWTKNEYTYNEVGSSTDVTATTHPGGLNEPSGATGSAVSDNSDVYLDYAGNNSN